MAQFVGDENGYSPNDLQPMFQIFHLGVAHSILLFVHNCSCTNDVLSVNDSFGVDCSHLENCVISGGPREDFHRLFTAYFVCIILLFPIQLATHSSVGNHVGLPQHPHDDSRWDGLNHYHCENIYVGDFCLSFEERFSILKLRFDFCPNRVTYYHRDDVKISFCSFKTDTCCLLSS